MAGRGRRSRRRKSDRKNEAEAAIRNLSDALEDSLGERIEIAG